MYCLSSYNYAGDFASLILVGVNYIRQLFVHYVLLWASVHEFEVVELSYY